MIILGIETSCDETALAVIEAEGDFPNHKIKLVAEALHSQAKLHEQYGGVFPALAKREHAKNLIPLFRKLIEELGFSNVKIKNQNEKLQSKIQNEIETILEREPELLKQFLEFIPTIEKPQIDAIAVTEGPGLEPALWVGINFAKTLSLVWGIPLIPVNHMEGHIASVLIDTDAADKRRQDAEGRGKKIEFPMIALLVSGGHTELVLAEEWMKYKLLGQTRDDAAGEAFDKVARILGLPYPGGPQISKLADEARASNTPALEAALPRPMLNSKDYDFSFSGLKTAVLYLVKKLTGDNHNLQREVGEKSALSQRTQSQIAREFEDAVTEVLIKKTKKAALDFGAKTVIFAGGVSANKNIRVTLTAEMQEIGVQTIIPHFKLSTDNAVMIAIAGYFRHKSANIQNADIKARGNLKITA